MVRERCDARWTGELVLKYETLEQSIDRRLNEPHEKCVECEMEKFCYADNRGVYLCTRWDDNWKPGMALNVQVVKNDSIKNELPPPKQKVVSKPRFNSDRQRGLF